MANKQTIDIHDRIFRWVIAVLKFLDVVPKTIKTTSLIAQLADSITSVGANDREANSALSVKDFCHKYGIVRKESDESIYWLRVIGELYDNLKSQTDQLINEGTEIINIVTAIIRNSRRTSNLRKTLKG